MTKNEKELFEMMKSLGLDIIVVSHIPGLKMEDMQVTHAIAMEHWQTGEPCVMLTSGNPDGKYSLYWDNLSEDFDAACEKIVDNY